MSFPHSVFAAALHALGTLELTDVASRPCSKMGPALGGHLPVSDIRAEHMHEYSETLFLGRYSLESGVFVICVVHAVICLVVLSISSSVVSLKLSHVQVTPQEQTWVAAWHLLGVGLLAGSMIGISERQELPVRCYFYYLLASALAVVGLCIFVLTMNGDCPVSKSHMAERVGVSLNCGLKSMGVLFALIFWSMGMAYALSLVWELKEKYRHLQRSALLGSETQSFLDSIRNGGQETNKLNKWAQPTPGSVPMWGTLPLKTASLS